jgi:uncharacterized membrane protein
MERDSWVWLLLPQPLRTMPADLAVICVLVAATNAAVFVPVLNTSPIRVLVGLGFVLFVPGYAFIAALFPESSAGSERDSEATSTADGRNETGAGSGSGSASASDSSSSSGSNGSDDTGTDTDSKDGTTADSISLGTDRGIDGIERVALSFGLSIAIVPLIGLVLNFTPFGIRLVPITVSLSGVTLLLTAVAVHRRRAVPTADRFRVPYRRWLAAGREELLESDSRTDMALNVLLIASIVLTVAAVGYAVAVPPQGEQFSEFYILTETEEGDLVADDYPETLTAGDPEPIHVGIGNQEYETVEYAVVVQLQRVEVVDNTTRVLDRTTVDRFDRTLEHNETSIERRGLVMPESMRGEDLRLTFLLYRGSPPPEPTADSAYRTLHLWVAVGE